MTENDYMIGKVFGDVKVLKYVGVNKQNRKLYRCKCKCGAVFVTTGTSLRMGKTKSCGCHGYADLKRKPNYNMIQGALEVLKNVCEGNFCKETCPLWVTCHNDLELTLSEVMQSGLKDIKQREKQCIE